jgi:hypothetical protein
MFLIPKLAIDWVRPLLAVLMVVCSLGFVSPTLAQEVDPNQDLAAMALNPLDLDAASLTGYGINSGQFSDGETYAAQVAAQMGRDGATLLDAFAANGFVNAYSLELNQAKELGDTTQGVTQVTTSSIVEFEDEAGAASAYAVLADTAAMPDSIDISDQVASGFAAEANVSPSAGFAPVAGVVAIRQEGKYIGTVVIAPSSGGTAVSPLIDRLTEKISILSTDGGPDLGRRALRLNGETVAADRGYYIIGYGAALRQVTQVDEEFERFEARYEGALNGYSQRTSVTTGDGTRLQLRTIVMSFETDEEASAWLQDAVERQGQLTSPDLIVVDEEFQTVGDESISLTYALSGGNGVRQATIRTGSNVAVIDIVNVERADVPGRILLDDLAAVQADCLENFCEAQEPPASFTSGSIATPRVEDEVDESTPVVVATEAPTEEPVAEATAVAETPVPPTTEPEAPAGNVASDELYGIQVEYDAAVWQPAGTSTDGTRSSFDLTNGVSTVSFAGDTKYAGDTAACFDDARVYLETVMGATNVTELLDAAGNTTIFITPEAAQGLYTYTDPSGALMSAFIYCTPLAAGTSTFLAIGTTPAAEITTQFPVMVELIQSAQVITG